MKLYDQLYLEKFNINSLDARLLSEEGLPELSSSVQDCFIPLEEFYTLEYQGLSYLVFAQCSDLFSDRAFMAYERKECRILFFYKNRFDELKTRYVNASLSNFIKSRSIYERFRFEARLRYKKTIVEKKKNIDDALFTKAVSGLYKTLIKDMHLVEKESYKDHTQYWPNLLYAITMNYSDHFQYVSEEFEIIFGK